MNNIAEILEKYPKGITLYSPLCGEVNLEEITIEHKDIFVATKDNMILSFNKYGQYLSNGECLLFPTKDVREWDKLPDNFGNGDFVVCEDEYNTQMFIVESYKSHKRAKCHIGYNFTDNSIFNKDTWHFTRIATEDEKKKLLEALKNEGYEWDDTKKVLTKILTPRFKIGDYIKKKYDPTDDNTYLVTNITEDYYYLEAINADKSKIVNINLQDNYKIDKFDITILKPFDKVLVRDNDESVWFPALYGNIRIMGGKTYYMTVNGHYKQCIPYKGNENLLGETMKCIDYYKTWD